MRRTEAAARTKVKCAARYQQEWGSSWLSIHLPEMNIPNNNLASSDLEEAIHGMPAVVWSRTWPGRSVMLLIVKQQWQRHCRSYRERVQIPEFKGVSYGPVALTNHPTRVPVSVKQGGWIRITKQFAQPRSARMYSWTILPFTAAPPLW